MDNFVFLQDFHNACPSLISNWWIRWYCWTRGDLALQESKPIGGIMKITPLENRVLIRPTEVDEVKKGEIIIPDSAKEKPRQGMVMEIGPDTKGIKKRDTVLYGKYSGTGVTIDDTEYLIMRESDILAIVGKL